MSSDPREANAPNGDDLFDLPSEAPKPVESAPLPSSTVGIDVDKVSSALPRRSPSSNVGGPPLTNVDASPTAIRDQTRLRSKPTEALPSAVSAPSVAARKSAFQPRTLWIACGAIAVVMGFVAGLVTMGGDGASPPGEPSTTTQASAIALEHATVPGPATEHAPTPEHAPAPAPARVAPIQLAPPEFDASALEFARTSIRTARDEMAAGSRGAARARLARVGLRIDAIRPTEREAIRADVALLLAECIQAEADEAARTP